MWYGQVRLMEDGKWPKSYLENRRKRGGPRITWLQDIQRAIHKGYRSIWEEEWKDTNLWRSRCGIAAAAVGTPLCVERSYLKIYEF